MALGETPVETPERKAFYDKIDKQNLTPLWAVMSTIITAEPKSALPAASVAL